MIYFATLKWRRRTLASSGCTVFLIRSRPLRSINPLRMGTVGGVETKQKAKDKKVYIITGQVNPLSRSIVHNKANEISIDLQIPPSAHYVLIYRWILFSGYFMRRLACPINSKSFPPWRKHRRKKKKKNKEIE